MDSPTLSNRLAKVRLGLTARLTKGVAISKMALSSGDVYASVNLVRWVLHHLLAITIRHGLRLFGPLEPLVGSRSRGQRSFLNFVLMMDELSPCSFHGFSHWRSRPVWCMQSKSRFIRDTSLQGGFRCFCGANYHMFVGVEPTRQKAVMRGYRVSKEPNTPLRQDAAMPNCGCCT